MTSKDCPFLAVSKAASLPTASTGDHWFVRDLWTSNAVGVIAGPPKSAKTLLALELAVTVASDTPCLGRFEAVSPGPVLVFLAEDSPTMTKMRLGAICRHKTIDLDTLELHFIEAPTLWLDLADDRQRLHRCLARLRPSMLILDPIERLFRTDDSGPRELSRLLGYLRGLQRHFELAIAVVHHSTAEHTLSVPGQQPSIPDDLLAWADSTLVISRREDRLVLRADHRFAPAPDPIAVDIVTHHDGFGAHLAIDSSPFDQGQLALPLSSVAG